MRNTYQWNNHHKNLSIAIRGCFKTKRQPLIYEWLLRPLLSNWDTTKKGLSDFETASTILSLIVLIYPTIACQQESLYQEYFYHSYFFHL